MKNRQSSRSQNDGASGACMKMGNLLFEVIGLLLGVTDVLL